MPRVDNGFEANHVPDVILHTKPNPKLGMRATKKTYRVRHTSSTKAVPNVTMSPWWATSPWKCQPVVVVVVGGGGGGGGGGVAVVLTFL